MGKNPWDRLPRETAKAHSAFMAYLRLGEARDLKKTAIEINGNYNTLNVWSSKWNWQSRSVAYDRHVLQISLERRTEVRETARQVAVDKIAEIVQRLMELLEGKCPGGDRDAQGYPIVKPSTRLQAGIHLLGIAGVTVTKRTEISGPDGSEIQLAARRAVKLLSDEKLNAIDAAFEEVKEDES